MERNSRLGALLLFDIFHPSVCFLLLMLPLLYLFAPVLRLLLRPGGRELEAECGGVMAAWGRIKDERRREPSFRRLINAISLGVRV